MYVQVSSAASLLGLPSAEATLETVCNALSIRTGQPAEAAPAAAPPVTAVNPPAADAPCVQLPHDDPAWWERVQQAWREPVADVADLEDRLQGLHGEQVDATGLRALEIFYGDDFTEAQFFESTFPHMVALALALPERCPSPIPMLEQRCEGMVELPRTAVASLIANMFLCNFKPPEGGLRYRKPDMPRGDFSPLLCRSQDCDVAKLRMFVHYFERLQTAAGSEGGPRGSLKIRRNVVQTPPNWLASTKPLRALSVREDSGIEAAVGSLQIDFANEFIGGGVLGRGAVQEEIRFTICPELCVSMLICPCMLDEMRLGGDSESSVLGVSEAIILTGAEQYSAYDGYAGGLRYAGDHVDETPRDEDGSLQTCISAIDAVRHSAGQVDVQFQDDYMGRELGKAYAGFKDTGDDTEASKKRCPKVATGNWGCGVFCGFDMLKAVLQWMASSEAGRDVEYYPYGADLGPGLESLGSAVKAAGNGVATVGFVFRGLMKFRSQLADSDGATDPAELFAFLIGEIEGAAAMQQQEEKMRLRTWGSLAKRSREYSLDIVPRLAYCRGPLVDLIVESGLHRYSEFISVQGSYLFVDGGLQRVPCSKGEVFKDKFIGMKEKRLLMKFMQTVLTYEPKEGSEVHMLASESGELHTNEAEVLRQKAAGVRKSEASTAAGAAAATAAATELDDWLDKPFVEFLAHRQLTETLITFILYALALQNQAPDGAVFTTEDGLASLRRYMGCLGRFADTHTAFISTMYGAGEIPQSFCRCCAVYGGVYVLRRTMRQLLVGLEPEPEPEAETVPVPEIAESDGTSYFRGIMCTAGQQLRGKYLVTGWDHVSALRPTFEAGEEVQVVARSVCITTVSLVEGVGTMLSVLPPNALPGTSSNDVCIRLQQMDRNARVGPVGEFVVHLSCVATVTAAESSEQAVAARQLELQAFLKKAARLLFDTASCTEVVNQTGGVAPSPEGAPVQGQVAPPPLPQAGPGKPELVYSLFFSKVVRTAPASSLPKNVFVVGEQHWGAMDFDGATVQARRIFEQIFPGEPFLPALPDPDAVNDEVALLLVSDCFPRHHHIFCVFHLVRLLGRLPCSHSGCRLELQETAGEGVDFVDREYTVTFGDGKLGLALLADKDGLIRVQSMAAGGAAASSGAIRKADIMMTVAGQPTGGMTVEEVVRFIGGAPRPLTLVFSSSVAVKEEDEA